MFKERIDFLPKELIQNQQQVMRYLAPYLSPNSAAEKENNVRTKLISKSFLEGLHVFTQDIKPKASYVFTEIKPSPNWLESKEGLILLPYKHPLSNKANHAILFATTLGSMIDEWILEFFKAKDYLLGYMLEAIGLAALQEIEIRVRKAFYDIIPGENLSLKKLSHTLCPECQGIPTGAQKELYQITEAHVIGITLQRDLVLYPLKSVTGIILAGQDLTIFQEDQCLYCNKKHDCLYRDKSKEAENKFLSNLNLL
ncbi:vitamin B12 dependent-methionine synthase activation domain-containing protein [Desulfitobacterium sp.]|uniref:vitamin B12 dependent-methionine synthase activation domain-containing protein n=1 Tax=Desulfitobacterium sp. TaxID=49981 RepID=UPI002C816651|nr:hypothetical protein [Desulfitobacterium sp.]HVJ50045.1 hypothetical protein [Desulfitobacterium sp.]